MCIPITNVVKVATKATFNKKKILDDFSLKLQITYPNINFRTDKTEHINQQ